MKKQKVDGLIAYYGLQDWWFFTFSETEREYIDNRYEPMGLSPHCLTQGEVVLMSQEITTFLSTLASWFRSSKDESINKRIRQKLVDIAKHSNNKKPGYFEGRHYSSYVPDIKNLKQKGDLNNVESLLLTLVNAVEAESISEKMQVAPYYYEELAKLYHKQKDYSKEISILERYTRQNCGFGPKGRLIERLEKAKLLLIGK